MKLKELEYPLGKVKETVHGWLYLENDQMLDVMYAVHVANQFETDPLWMIFIAPPSHAKTELLRSFEGHKKAYFLSTLTPATLVSGMRIGKKKDVSLLPKLNNKTLIMKDFTTILAMRSEHQQEIIAQLREVYDGSLYKDFGNDKSFSWKGRVGLMAACTPVYDRHHGVIGALGERFLLYRTENENDEKMGFQAQRIVGQEDDMRREIRNATHTFVNQFENINDLHFSKDEIVNHMIITLACFCAYGRCPVVRNYRDRHVEYLPAPAGPARLVKQFMQLGMGLALIHGKRIIDVATYEIIKKVGRDLIPAQRLKVLRYLWEEKMFEHTQHWMRTKCISDDVFIPGGTVIIILEDLMMIGLLNRKRDGEGETAPYTWQLTEKAKDFLKGAQVFEKTKDEPF